MLVCIPFYVLILIACMLLIVLILIIDGYINYMEIQHHQQSGITKDHAEPNHPSNDVEI